MVILWFLLSPAPSPACGVALLRLLSLGKVPSTAHLTAMPLPQVSCPPSHPTSTDLWLACCQALLGGSFGGQVSHKNLSGRVTTTETKPVFLATCWWWQQESLVLVWTVPRGRCLYQRYHWEVHPQPSGEMGSWHVANLFKASATFFLRAIFPLHASSSLPSLYCFPGSHPCPGSFGEAGCLRATSSVQQPDLPTPAIATFWSKLRLPV